MSAHHALRRHPQPGHHREVDRGVASTTRSSSTSPRARPRREIKAAVEALFKVKVTAVNTLVRKGKNRSASAASSAAPSDVKNAIVTLAEGQSIDVTTGL